MKYRWLAIALLLAATWSWAQTDIVYPWVTNQSQFRGVIVINNLNSEAVTVNLTATRQEGQTPESDSSGPVVIEPFGQMASPAGDLFPNLGEGGGFVVRLTSDASNITGGFIISGTGSPSQSSPAQANVAAASDASLNLLFNYLPAGGTGFSAPVVVNMGNETANVIFHAYLDGCIVASSNQQVGSGYPLAALSRNLFPEVSGDLYVVAESDQPLLGVAFIFNADLEPSMANAVGIETIPSAGPCIGPPDPVSFSAQIQPILNASCGNGLCHLSGQSAASLRLDSDVSYSELVGVKATGPGFNNLNRVEPGDPDNSYLYRKLLSAEEASYFGNRMPNSGVGRPPLDDASLQLIRDWILQGAADN